MANDFLSSEKNCLYKSMMVERDPQKMLLNIQEMKGRLRISHREDDSLLTHLLEISTESVEEDCERSLVPCTRTVTFNNINVILPFGPVIKILKVRHNKKDLSSEDYETRPFRGSVMLTLKEPFRWTWKDPELMVVYRAGFEDEEGKVCTPISMKEEVWRELNERYQNRMDLVENRKERRRNMWRSYENFLAS